MAEALWKSEEVVAAVSGNLRGGSFEATGVSIDSRTLKKGDIFVALSGDRFDGHNFLEQVAAAGAAAAIVSRMPAGIPQGFPLIAVHHTGIALEELGRAARRRSKGRIIGVTGSVGKTSAKEMLRLALSPYGRVYATAGNYNNHIGLPLMLANMPRESEFGIFEMGMNHPGEIEFLSRMAEPEVSIITAVEAVHLEFFESVSAIAQAKAEIFSGMHAGGVAVLDSDSPHFPLLQQEAEKHELKLITFGVDDEADFRLLDADYGARGTEARYQAGSRKASFSLGSLGMHWPKLACGILAVVAALDLSLEKAMAALAAFTEQPGRGQLVVLPWKHGEITVIDDSYNASPVSMRGGLERLGMLQGQRRIAVLGEMLELGPEGERYHAELEPVIAAQKLDQIYLVGQGMQVLKKMKNAVWSEHASVQEAALLAEILPGDVILFKGSHGSKVYQLVEALKKHAGQQARQKEAQAV